MKQHLKKWGLLGSLLACTLFLVFFVVYRNTQLVKFSFEKQRLEKQYAQLVQERQRKQEQLLLAQDHSKVRDIARTKLGMQKIDLSQISLLAVS